MESNPKITLSTGAAESAGVVVISESARDVWISIPPRHSKSLTLAMMAAAVTPPSPGPDVAVLNLRDPAITAEAARTDAELHEINRSLFPAAARIRTAERAEQRAARKVRMAAKRRRGW